MLGFLIFALVLGLFGAVGKLASGAPESGLFLRLLSLLVLFFFVGQFEELCFRAVLNDAIVYQFRETKGVFVLSIVISSLVFGGPANLGAGNYVVQGSDAIIGIITYGVQMLIGMVFVLLIWKK